MKFKATIPIKDDQGRTVDHMVYVEAESQYKAAKKAEKALWDSGVRGEPSGEPARLERVCYTLR